MDLQYYIHKSYMRASSLQHRFFRRFTTAGVMVVACIVISAGLGLDTNRTMAFQAFTFLSALLLISFIAILFYKPRFSVNIDLPPSATAGIPFRYTVEIINLTAKPAHGAFLKENLKDPRPTYEEFRDMKVSAERGVNAWDRFVGPIRWTEVIAQRSPVKQPEHRVGYIPPHGSVKLDLEATPTNRGFVYIDSASVGVPDPLGLVKSVCQAPGGGSLPVFPRLYKTPHLTLPGRRKYNQGGVALASNVGDSEEFVGLRDYRPGDPLRKIHWRSWAKSGKPVVKEHQEEYYSRHALLLDTFMDEDICPQFEEAVNVAASFVTDMETQETLLDLMFVGDHAYLFTSGRSLGATRNMLEILSSVTPCRKKSFQALAHSVSQRLGLLSGVLCILVSWDKERRDFIREMVSTCVPIKVFLVLESIPEGGIDPGPMKGQPDMFHVLETGKVAEALAQL